MLVKERRHRIFSTVETACTREAISEGKQLNQDWDQVTCPFLAQFRGISKGFRKRRLGVKSQLLARAEVCCACYCKVLVSSPCNWMKSQKLSSDWEVCLWLIYSHRSASRWKWWEPWIHSSRICLALLSSLSSTGCQEQPRSHTSSFFFVFNPHQRVCLLVLKKEEEGRGESIDVRNIHWSPPIPTAMGSNPQPRYVYRVTSNQLSHQARAQTSSFTSSKRKCFSSHSFS